MPTKPHRFGWILLCFAIVAIAEPSAAQKNLIVIDAGHGGVDPGAIGPSGTKEKNVVLSIAERVAEILREDPSLDVRMTRTRDTLIALEDRPKLANSWRDEGGQPRPALFMSIHANAHNSRSAKGYETYFLSEAKTDDARRVAAMENSAQRFETPKADKLDPLTFIFNDLRQNEYMHESSDWADMIQRRMGAIHPGPNRGVKQAGLVVLIGAFMPAVLVETGFISNPGEEQMLRDPARQEEMAIQLAAAVQDFFRRTAATSVAGGY